VGRLLDKPYVAQKEKIAKVIKGEDNFDDLKYILYSIHDT